MARHNARERLPCKCKFFRNERCERGCRNESELSTHRESQHLGIRYRCSCSDNDITRLQDLKYHIRTENEAAARKKDSLQFRDVLFEHHAPMPCVVLPGYQEKWTDAEHEEFDSKLTTPPRIGRGGNEMPQDGMMHAWLSKPRKSRKSRIPEASSVPRPGSSDEAATMPFPTPDTSIEDWIHLPPETCFFVNWPEDGEDFGQPSTLDDSIAYSRRDSPSKGQGPSTACTSTPELEEMADGNSTKLLHSETAAASEFVDSETLVLVDIGAMDGPQTTPADDLPGPSLTTCQKPGQCKIHGVDRRLRTVTYDCTRMDPICDSDLAGSVPEMRMPTKNLLSPGYTSIRFTTSEGEETTHEGSSWNPMFGFALFDDTYDAYDA